jgi:uncharacterized protein YcbK (DUF882 family)
MRINKNRTLATRVVGVLLWLTAVGVPVKTDAFDGDRFFIHGDGRIKLINEKTGESFAGKYRIDLGNYDPSAMEAICRVFNAPCESQKQVLSLRLIEFLDFLQDRLRPGARITITSGYRSPEYNTKVRQQGGLAAKASLHQYGMAVDLEIEGFPARRLWEYVKALGFGGAGYYHGKTVHIDVGPARSWDEKTSGVGTGISNDNKLIGLVVNYDVYLPGEPIAMRFIRMTAFPIGVATEFSLSRRKEQGGSQKVTVFKPIFAITAEGPCSKFADIDQMASIRWRLPAKLSAGRYQIRAEFCDNPWEEMPPEISTPEFEIK